MTLSPPTSRTITGLLDAAEDATTFSITATTEAGAQAIVTLAARTYDGATVIDVLFSAVVATVPANAAGNVLTLNLWDGSTDLGRICVTQWPTTSGTLAVPLYGRRTITPTAGSHTYSVRGWRTNANCTVGSTAPHLPTRLTTTRVALL